MKSDLFKTNIEEEERTFRYIVDVVDHVTDKVSFEVDMYDLIYNLERLNKGEALVLRDDCTIAKIAD